MATIDQVPALYSQDGMGPDAIVYMRFFHPRSGWEWLVLEASQEGDWFTFFGLVKGFEEEMGYFSSEEFEDCGVRNDATWTPKPLKAAAPEYCSRIYAYHCD